MKSSRELRHQAWDQLRKSYWMVFVVTLIVAALPAASSIAVVGFIIAGPLLVGQAIYLIDMVETNSDGKKIELVIEGFKKSFVNSFLAMLLVGVFTFLWSLLFIIPGIIKYYAYAMTPFIIAEDPEIDAMAAIAKSQEMMRGHKMELFILQFSFIGWYLLAALTFGVGFIFLLPYVKTAEANFYVELRGKKVVVAEIE
ncbi:MAG: DUF975 family protein [Acholeplasmataceae bacterium]|jgi:uncharacterized membrane protein|nr:DUF975 family protein [Acholeplasmataceae bacterium]